MWLVVDGKLVENSVLIFVKDLLFQPITLEKDVDALKVPLSLVVQKELSQARVGPRAVSGRHKEHIGRQHSNYALQQAFVSGLDGFFHAFHAIFTRLSCFRALQRVHHGQSLEDHFIDLVGGPHLDAFEQ
jgi:hypothetical protein